MPVGKHARYCRMAIVPGGNSRTTRAPGPAVTTVVGTQGGRIMRRRSLNVYSVALVAMLAAAASARAEDGVSADKILFGQAAPLTGPAAALGQGMRTGINAAFAETNQAGGVKGRKLELKSADDGYEPTKSIDVVKKL